MTFRKPMLCIDTVSLQHPELIGLEGERLDAQEWLAVFTDAEQARRYARTSSEGLEVWVSGSDQVDGINLAAAMKRDRVDVEVNLLSFSSGGSLLSRARAAGIDRVLDQGAFLDRYRNEKMAWRKAPLAVGEGPRCDAVAPGAAVPGSAVPHACQCGCWQPSMTATAPSAPVHDVLRGAAGTTAPSSHLGEQRGEGSQAPSSAFGCAAQTAHALPKTMLADSPKGYVMTVVGAGGGTGKSTVSTLLACCCQASGRKTVLVDADLQFGDVSYLCGCEAPLRVDDLVEAPLRVEGLSKGGRLPAVVAAPERMERSELAAQHLMGVIDMLRRRFEVVVVNTGPSWGDLHVQLMEASSNVLFVIDQRPSSIRACKHALGLCSRCGIASKPFLFAVNRCSRKALFSSIDVSCALQGAHVHELQDGGKAVEELLGTGQPFDLMDSGNALARSIAELVDAVVPVGSSDPGELVVPQRRRRLRLRRRRS